MSQEYFDTVTLHWGRLCIEIEKYTPNRACFFVSKKYYNTTFNTKQIVALWSVNKFFRRAAISQLFLHELVNTKRIACCVGLLKSLGDLF